MLVAAFLAFCQVLVIHSVGETSVVLKNPLKAPDEFPILVGQSEITREITLKIGGFVLLLRNHFRPFGQSIGRSSFRQSVGRFVSYFHIVILLSCCPLFVFFLLIPCGTFVVEACVASWLYSQAAFILTFHFFLKEPKTIFGK